MNLNKAQAHFKHDNKTNKTLKFPINFKLMNNQLLIIHE